jgi:hypothetical protein
VTPPGYVGAVRAVRLPVSWHAKNLAEPDLMHAASRANGPAGSRAESAICFPTKMMERAAR